MNAALLALWSLAAVAAPLLAYSVSLAAFGLAHVLSELRYVVRRFGPRAPRWAWISAAVLLAGVAGLRVARLAGAPAEVTAPVECALVAALAALAWPLLRDAAPLHRALAAATVLAVGAGAAFAPFATILALAVLHNLTPLGFLAEARVPRRELVLWTGLFVGLPLVVATGLPSEALAAAGLAFPEATVLPTGALSRHLHTYLPREVHDATWAVHAFSAAVLAQGLHYHVVIRVLPSLPGGAAPSRIAAALGTLAAVALAAGFAFDFARAREVYGVAAAVHAWIELPVLIAWIARPVPNDAEFATSESAAADLAGAGTRAA